jgi:HPt (histidine-containing phosphotransfer) domain-containing protein
MKEDSRLDGKVVDIAGALQRLGGDKELLRELAVMFAEDVPLLLSRVEQAIAEHEAANLQRAAHSIKGLAANFGATQVVLAAQALESLGEQGQLDQAPLAVVELRKRLNELDDALANLFAE